jgi:hypothetical protein
MIDTFGIEEATLSNQQSGPDINFHGVSFSHLKHKSGSPQGRRTMSPALQALNLRLAGKPTAGAVGC